MLKVYCMSYPSWRPIWWCWWIQEGISLVVSLFSNLNLTIKQWQDYSNVLNAGSFSFCITTQNKSCEQLKVTLPIDRNKEVSFFSSYIKKKTGWHQTQDHPFLCTTEPNRNRHECHLRGWGHYYTTNWRRPNKTRDKIFEKSRRGRHRMYLLQLYLLECIKALSVFYSPKSLRGLGKWNIF